MKAAAAARKWWAAHRRPSREPTTVVARAGQNTWIVRIASVLLVILAGAMILCAGIGFTVTQFDDSRLEIERQVALRQALEEFRAVSGDVDRIGESQLRLIERRAGLKGLRFDSDPAGDVGREVQSLLDSRGRIVGWFSWVSDRALIQAMNRLWGLAAAVGIALALCAYLAARAAQRLARVLDRTTEMVHRLTSQDALTGLPNHRVMLEELDAALARRGSGTVAFALVDLDGFHEVNDALGRAGGDAVLMSVADHLRASLPAGAVFGRFEEDEFAVIVASDHPRICNQLTDCIRAALFRPVFMERMWQITAGVGLAQAPEDGTTGEQLARRASLALRAAKREGRGTARLFAPQIETEGAERRFLLRELESAIALQAFDVHYQPIVAAAGGGIIGVEALLRWTHPTRGAIAPSVFIPLAEQTGLMSQLGEIALRRALADGVRWPKIFVSVNLSPRQIRDRWLVDLVGAIMAETGIASSRVVLEVTEGILIQDLQETQIRLEALRALGVSIALDDFGTGYSSMSYLQKFPFDRLKIDRAFVASLASSGNTAAIIHSIVTLGHALGMKVLAEGVETDEQRVLLRLAGCDEMQGLLFARPAPAAEIDQALARPPRSAADQRSLLTA
jgi:diguanylate cyclase (GGDEF)-like protein